MTNIFISLFLGIVGFVWASVVSLPAMLIGCLLSWKTSGVRKISNAGSSRAFTIALCGTISMVTISAGAVAWFYRGNVNMWLGGMHNTAISVGVAVGLFSYFSFSKMIVVDTSLVWKNREKDAPHGFERIAKLEANAPSVACLPQGNGSTDVAPQPSIGRSPLA
jgi:hypothetical protein